MQFLHWQQAIHLGRKSQVIGHFRCPLSQNTTEGLGCKQHNSPVTCAYIHTATVVGAMGMWESKRRPKSGDIASFVMDSLLLWLLWLTYKELHRPAHLQCFVPTQGLSFAAWREWNKLSDTFSCYSKKTNPWLERITEKWPSNTEHCLVLAKRSSPLERP